MIGREVLVGRQALVGREVLVGLALVNERTTEVGAVAMLLELEGLLLLGQRRTSSHLLPTTQKRTNHLAQYRPAERDTLGRKQVHVRRREGEGEVPVSRQVLVGREVPVGVALVGEWTMEEGAVAILLNLEALSLLAPRPTSRHLLPTIQNLANHLAHVYRQHQSPRRYRKHLDRPRTSALPAHLPPPLFLDRSPR